MINKFDNTEIAFKSKTDKDLRRAYWLFKTLASPIVVKTSKMLTKLAIKFHLPFGWAVKPSIYKHFVGGETLEGCQPAVDHLKQFNVKGILDYSVEGNKTAGGIEIVLDETLKSIHRAASDENIPFAVFKPTAFTIADVLEKSSLKIPLNDFELIEAGNFRKRINLLCQTAYEKNIPILIDAEDTFYQNFIDEVVTEMMVKYNKDKAIVYNTLQMYRWDKLKFLRDQLKKAKEGNYFLGMKYVRGAYMEKERERAIHKGYRDPIQPNKAATDRDYNEAIQVSIENIDRISVFNGTHNEESCLFLMELMEKHNIAKNDQRVYTAQLYGMSDHISFNMASEGYNVCKYIPYGPVKHVIPYLIRRAEENTSVAGQTSRELRLITIERNRRKLNNKKNN
jgi:proline dehydrogenase